MNDHPPKLPTEAEAEAQIEEQKRIMGLDRDPFPPGHLGDWMDQLRRENDRFRWGLQWMLNNLTGIDHEWAKEACAIARQSLNPQPKG